MLNHCNLKPEYYMKKGYSYEDAIRFIQKRNSTINYSKWNKTKILKYTLKKWYNKNIFNLFKKIKFKFECISCFHQSFSYEEWLDKITSPIIVDCLGGYNKINDIYFRYFNKNINDKFSIKFDNKKGKYRIHVLYS